MDLGSVNIRFKGDASSFAAASTKVNTGLAKTSTVAKQAAVDTTKLTLGLDKMRIQQGLLAEKIAKSGDKTGLLGNKMKSLSHDIKLAEGKLQQASIAAKHLADAEQQVATKAVVAEKSTGRLGSTLGMAKKMAGAFGLTMGAAGVAGGFMKAVTAGIKFNSSIEQTTISMKTMLGSQEKANKLIKEMTAFAAKTPYEFPELADATKKLLAFGVAADNIIPTMTRLGDISAGLGIEVGELAELYGKAKVQGRLFAEDVNQLTGRGIPVIQEFAKQFGVAESEVRGLVEKGKVGFPQLEEAIRSLTSEGGKFGGLMEAQSKSLAGQWSTLKDNLSQLAGTMAKPIFSYLTEKLLPKAIKLLEDFGAAVKDKGWGKAISDLVRDIDWGKVGAKIGSLLGDAIRAAGPIIVKVVPELVKGAFKGAFMFGFDIGEQIGRGMRRSWDASIKGMRASTFGSSLEDFKRQVREASNFPVYSQGGEEAIATVDRLNAQFDALVNTEEEAVKWGERMKEPIAAFLKVADAAGARMEALVNTMSGKKEGMVDPAQIWENAKGSLKQYMKDVDVALKSWATFNTNIRTLAAQYGKQYGVEVINKLATMSPDFAAALMGQPADMQRKILDGLQASLPKSGDVIKMGWNIGGQLGTGMKGGIAAAALVSRIKDVLGFPNARATGVTIGSNLFSGIQDYFNAHSVRVRATSSGGGIGHATGWVGNTPHMAMIAENHKAEAVVPLEDPVRKQQVLREAGLLNEGSGTDTAAMEAAIMSGISRAMDMFINRFGRLAASGAF